MLRYIQLLMLEKKGIVKELKCQIEYILQDVLFTKKKKDNKKLSYYADFEYIQDSKLITEDAKGFRTAEYKMKKEDAIKKIS